MSADILDLPPPKPVKVSFMASNVARAIQCVARAASTDPTRPVLTTVHIVTDGIETMTIEATDSYRLYIAEVKLHQATGSDVFDIKGAELEICLPTEWLLRQLKPKPRGGDVWTWKLDLGKRSFSLHNHNEGTTNSLTLPHYAQAEFPGTKHLIPTSVDEDAPVSAATKYLRCAFTAALAFTDGQQIMEVHSISYLKPMVLAARSGDDRLTMLIMPLRNQDAKLVKYEEVGL